MKKYLATTTPNKFIKVELYYNKGGETEWARRISPRAYMLHISAVEKREVSGVVLESYCPSDSKKLILKDVVRASKKAEKEAEEIAESCYHGYAYQVAEKNGLTLAE